MAQELNNNNDLNNALPRRNEQESRAPERPAAKEPAPRAGEPSALSNTLAIIGFIILVVIVVWGLFHIASLTAPWLSSLFTRSTPAAIEVIAPPQVNAGVPFVVNWKYATKESGTYALLYTCKDGAGFKTIPAIGTPMSIPCNATFALASTSTSLMLLPTHVGTTSVAVPISILFVPATGTKQAQGETTVTVNPARQPTPTPLSPIAPVPPSPKPPTADRPRVPADLSVRIISASADTAGFATVIFDIVNVGGSPTGAYTFSAQLPTQSPYLYVSPLQSSLNPDDHIQNTLRFSQTIPGTISISISAADQNQSNNYASQHLNAPVPYPYPQQYQYQYPY